MIFDAFNEYHQHTCIQFRKCKTVSKCDHYLKLVKVDDRNDCSSEVGLQKTKSSQTVNLDAGCWHLGTVIHELAHAVGLIHEQQRPDYRDHIVINWENVNKSQASQFNYTKNETPVTLTPFDLHSITIYDSKAFQKTGFLNDTITPKNPNVTLPHSSDKPGLSEMDIRGLNKLYNCTTLDTNNQ